MSRLLRRGTTKKLARPKAKNEGEGMSKTRYDELLSKARAFHKAHPEVKEAFRKTTLQLIDRGFKHWSAGAVIDIVRWEGSKGNTTNKGDFKINDHCAPFYARDFRHHNPEHREFFRIRRQSSRKTPGSGLPELTPDDFPYGDPNPDESLDEPIQERLI